MSISEIHADMIISLYHSSLFAGHQGITMSYFTIGDEIFLPSLIHHLT